jgi:16S rRNA (guanine966-N2)-methyltransferase
MQVIHRNIQKTHLEKEARPIKMPVSEALRLLGKEGASFDIIFMDPPYAMAATMATTVSELVRKYGLLREDGILIVESDSETLINENVTNMTCLKSCKYGATLVTFFLESETMCE